MDTVLVQGLVMLILPLPKLVNMYMNYISLAALTAASLLSRHYVLNETQAAEKDRDASVVRTTSPGEPPAVMSTPLPSISSTIDIINISPHAQFALKFVREFRSGLTKKNLEHSKSYEERNCCISVPHY